MKLQMTKIAAALALTVAASGAQADAVIGMTLADVFNNNNTATAADDVLGTDGRSGAFRFGPINATYTGASLFGPANGGVIDMSAATAPTEWTNGFVFAGSPFQPFTTGPIVADITGGVLTVSSLPFAGYYVGADFVFNMTPDAGTINVLNLVQIGANDYAYRIGFSHEITEADDPSFTYVGFNANWMLEGVMTTVPEASTYGMMLAGLGLVGFAVRRRKMMA